MKLHEIHNKFVEESSDVDQSSNQCLVQVRHCT